MQAFFWGEHRERLGRGLAKDFISRIKSILGPTPYVTALGSCLTSYKDRCSTDTKSFLRPVVGAQELGGAGHRGWPEAGGHIVP